MTMNNGSDFMAGAASCNLRLGVNEIIGAEEALDMSFVEIGEQLSSRASMRVVRALFAEGLTVEGKRVSSDAAGTIIETIGLAKAAALVAESLAAVFRPGDQIEQPAPLGAAAIERATAVDAKPLGEDNVRALIEAVETGQAVS